MVMPKSLIQIKIVSRYLRQKMEYHLSFTYGGSTMCCENIKMTTVSSLPEIMRKQIRIIDYKVY